MILVFNIVVLLVWSVVLLSTVIHKAWMWNAFIYSSYYIVLAMTAAWAFSLINLWHEKKANPALFIKSNWRGLVFSLVLTSIVFVSVPNRLRVFSDETNLLSVAKSMTFDKNVYNVVESRSYYGMFWPDTPSFIEKRPLLFPFFISLMHAALGYRVENVFILNYFVLWAVLFFLYLLTRSSIGELLAFASLLLVMSQPILAWIATSGGFELFNFLFILIGFISLRYFLHNSAPSSFLVLILSLVMLSNIRYESVLFLVVVMGVLGFARYIPSRSLLNSPACAAVPFFLLPWVWQRVLMLTEEVDDFSGGTWLQEFHLTSVGENIWAFVQFILRFNGELGYAGVINLLGILAAIYFLIRFYRTFRSQDIDRTQSILWIVSAICICTHFVGTLLYRQSIGVHPMHGRYYIMVLIILSILPIFFLANILKDQRRLAVPVFLGTLMFFVYYHPVAIEDRPVKFLYANREFRFVTDFLKKNADQKVLVVCDRPGQLIVYNYGAIFFRTANRDVDEILQSYRNHLYSSIYVVQPIGQSPWDSGTLDPRYQLETVAESQISGNYSLRISRVGIPQ